MNNNKLIFLVTIIPILLVPNVYAGGPRNDYDEAYKDVEGAPECWVDGYDAGFAGKYNEDRADECNDIPGDQYNRSWPHGCKDAGFAQAECNTVREGTSDERNDSSNEDLKQANMNKCWDDGFEDGQNNPFNQERFEGCHDYQDMYYKGFIAGCKSAGNTKEMCASSGHNNNSGDNSNEPDRLKITATLNVPSSWCGREFQVTLRTEGVSYTEYKDECTGDVEFAPAPIGINEEFTVCAQASNGVVNGCQSSVNGPEAEPERITINID